MSVRQPQSAGWTDKARGFLGGEEPTMKVGNMSVAERGVDERGGLTLSKRSQSSGPSFIPNHDNIEKENIGEENKKKKGSPQNRKGEER